MELFWRMLELMPAWDRVHKLAALARSRDGWLATFEVAALADVSEAIARKWLDHAVDAGLMVHSRGEYYYTFCRDRVRRFLVREAHRRGLVLGPDRSAPDGEPPGSTPPRPGDRL